MFATFSLSPTWSLNTNLDLLYRYMSGNALDITNQSITASNQGFRWGYRLDTQLQLDKGWTLQANVGYRGRDIQLQGFWNGFVQYSLGARKAFAGKRGSLGWPPRIF